LTDRKEEREREEESGHYEPGEVINTAQPARFSLGDGGGVGVGNN
jgi:hypothetical protein